MTAGAVITITSADGGDHVPKSTLCVMEGEGWERIELGDLPDDLALGELDYASSAADTCLPVGGPNLKVMRHLRMIGAAIVLVALIGMVGFHFIEGWPWFDGLYMVVTTLTTIGYQEVHPLSHAGRMFNVGIIIAGVALVFLAIGALTQALLEFELQSFFGRRRMEREIGRLSGHYIICGAGRVGRSAARELARRPVPFVILEQMKRKLSASPAKIG